MDAVTDFYRSQIGGMSVINYSYTDAPWRLFLEDVYYFFVYSPALPRVLLPLVPTNSGELAELYPSRANLFCLAVHFLLMILQFLFLGGLVLVLFLPVWLGVGFVGVCLLLNWLFCRLLNGKDDTFTSDEKYAKALPEHQKEQWIFLNGVAVGEHWMNQNLNQLAITFGRPILGIHNRTSGLIFDIIECLIQRNLCYATKDVRICYKIIKDVLYDPSKTRVIFILHSQGGIEGSLVVDWLLQEMPQDLLSKLEVYTFGNAANHFNNPHRRVASQTLTMQQPRKAMATMVTETIHPAIKVDGVVVDAAAGDGDSTCLATLGCDSTTLGTWSAAKDGAIGHVEHYAHATDFVAMWGVLHFATNKMGSARLPRFMGRLFDRRGGRGGHLLNQHYLDGMFPLDKDARTGQFVGAAEENEFMEEFIEIGREGEDMEKTREAFGITYMGTIGITQVERPDGSKTTTTTTTTTPMQKYRVKDLSRLWHYRNGRSPAHGQVYAERS